jgi:hypothetical protein
MLDALATPRIHAYGAALRTQQAGKGGRIDESGPKGPECASQRLRSGILAVFDLQQPPQTISQPRNLVSQLGASRC